MLCDISALVGSDETRDTARQPLSVQPAINLATERSQPRAIPTRLLRAALLPLICAVDTFGLGSAVQAANPPSPQWSQVPPSMVAITSPVWSSAPPLQSESGWQVIDASRGLPSTWQAGPSDVARPPQSTAVQVRSVGRGFTVNGNP